MKKSVLIIITTLFVMNTFAQTGPGGVGSNDGSSSLEFWYMAQDETYNDGDLIGSITDRSGNGRSIVGIAGERPIFTATTAAINNMSSMLFDGNDELETTYQGNSNENMSYGVIFNYVSQASTNVIIQHGGRNLMSLTSGDFYSDFVGASSHTASITASATWSYHSKTFANSGANRLKFYVNQDNVATFNHNIENRISNTWIGGNGNGGGAGLKGGIAEVYKFSRVLNSAEQIIIANYMAAKYNISLTVNDFYNEDNSGNGNYDYDVAGIGRVDATNLHDDSQGTGMVRVLNPTNLDDDEFLMWGHDNGVAEATNIIDVPLGVIARFDRVWRVSERNASNASSVNVGDIDMQWDLSGLNAVTPSDLRLLIDTDNDGLFADETPIAGAVSLGGNIYGFIKVPGGTAGIRNNRRFTLATVDKIQTPLPVELISFEANANEDKVDLEWITASEINNDFFTIERSSDAINWEDVSKINGAGNSNQTISYYDVDYNPIVGTSYYRLKQTDFNGEYKYSNIVPVKFIKGTSENQLINIFPNPANSGSIVQLKFENITEDEILVVLRDIKGREFYSKIHIDIVDGKLIGIPIDDNVPKGIYLITATSENQIYSQKLIVK